MNIVIAPVRKQNFGGIGETSSGSVSDNIADVPTDTAGSSPGIT